MAKFTILFAAILCIFCTLDRTSAFSLGNLNRHNNRVSKEQIFQTQSSFSISSDKEQQPISETSAVVPNKSNSGLKQSLLAGCITFLTTTPFASFADDLEVTELPPPFVPVIFAIVVIGGVGVLTASLGDVYTEESNLGLQSGARAKKERERSRSSYFKK
eukprot:scaffold41023_cov122-Skeletonema_dohrnii-CCMP3373.AAC.2